MLVYQFRSFRNTDPPHLAAIWCSQQPHRGLAQPVSAAQLEASVFSKTLFDRDGLIVATQDGLPRGFVHAGFGPTDDENRLSTELGVTCMLMVHSDVGPGEEAPLLAAELLRHGEAYLRQRGARLLYAGGIRPINPFYLGLYGGSELPGVLESDRRAHAVYRAAGYEEIDRVIVLQCDLTRFRPVTTRRQLTIRRQTEVSVTRDLPTCSWWQASVEGNLDRTQFMLADRSDGTVLATATFWDIEPLATMWGLRAAGLLDLSVAESHHRRGLATHLLGEALRQLRGEGVMLVEAQTMQHNTASLGFYRTMGFVNVDRGTVLRKGH